MGGRPHAIMLHIAQVGTPIIYHSVCGNTIGLYPIIHNIIFLNK